MAHVEMVDVSCGIGWDEILDPEDELTTETHGCAECGETWEETVRKDGKPLNVKHHPVSPWRQFLPVIVEEK